MVVYCTTNLLNGRRYIGLDSKNDPNYLGSGKILKTAIARYGRENFRKDILTHCKNMEDLCKMEAFYIKRLNAVESPKFYNIAEGGGIVVTVPIKQYSKKGELIKIWNSISSVEKELGFNNSKIIRAAKGGSITAYGFIWRYLKDDFDKYRTIPKETIISKEHKEILSNLHKGELNPMYNRKGINHPNSVKINQYDLNNNFIKTWDSIIDIKRDLGINNIHKCCIGKRNKAGEFHWKYYEEIVRSSEKSEKNNEEE